MNTTLELIEDIKQGKMVILVDDEDRENEGDLVIAADFITAETVNFMAKEARGLICLSLTESQIKNLGLSLMVKDEVNSSPNGTAFTVSIEAAQGVSTGISAADRAHTMRVAADPKSTSADITVPGHVFPIKARKGGVLKRAGHTEGSIDLSVLAGCSPAGVICEIMNPDGTMARVPELKEFAKKHNLKIGTIEDLIEYRIETESFVIEKASSKLDSDEFKGFDVRVFQNTLDGKEHLALVYGQVKANEPTLVRVHRANVLNDVFSLSNRRDNINKSLRLIQENGSGIFVYLRQQDDMSSSLESIVNKLNIDLSDIVPNALDKAKVNQRNYGVGAQILHALGVSKINLISNSPAKIIGLKGYGLEVVETTSLMQPIELKNHEVQL